MVVSGINKKRLAVSSGLGALMGIFCVAGTIVLNPSIESSYIFHMWYLRFILGMMLGFMGEVRLIESELGNSIIRGSATGILLSIPYFMVPVPTVLNYFIAGIVFGLLIDLISTKIAPQYT